MNLPAQIILTLLGGGGVAAIIAAIISAVTSKDARKADAAKDLVDTATSLVTPLRAELAQARQQIATMQDQIDRLGEAIATSAAQFQAVTHAVRTLTQLVDIVAPLLASEHPNLAAELLAAAEATRQAVDT